MINELLDTIFFESNLAKQEALTAIYEIGLSIIGADLEIKDGDSENLRIVKRAGNTLKASQRKAWAKACGVAEK